MLTSCLWSPGKLHEILPKLALQSNITEHAGKIHALCSHNNTYEDKHIGQWMEFAALSLKIDIIPTEWRYSETRDMLRCIGPSLIQLPGEEGTSLFLAVLKGGRRHVTVLAPDLKEHSVQREDIFTIL
ncbi:MAG: hypothetical protein D3910_27910, partial [Candidatus Electrothrix sp. ATG2]|nr:hypothetical protein [Candidatus Electrothrix sp. ATG2]